MISITVCAKICRFSGLHTGAAVMISCNKKWVLIQEQNEFYAITALICVVMHGTVHTKKLVHVTQLYKGYDDG